MEIVVNTLSESYASVMKFIIWNHCEVTTEDNEKTWQSDPILITITNPTSSDYIHKNSPYGKQFYEQYASAIVYGYTESDSKFVYDYHSRLFEYYDYDGVKESSRWTNQIQYVIDKLNESRTTRRAIAITWNPSVDTTNKDVPCLQSTQFWILNDLLEMSIHIRSNDMLMGYPQNIYGFVELMKFVASKTGVKIGKVYYYVAIPHCYYIRDGNYLKPWM
ncbi:MAG: thymidylate synthase [Dehalococcoidales bacterium]|jgi:thymidylate synthase